MTNDWLAGDVVLGPKFFVEHLSQLILVHVVRSRYIQWLGNSFLGTFLVSSSDWLGT